MWICQDLKTGAVVWDDGNALTCGDGAIIAAEEKLYLYSDKGEVWLVDATPKAFNLVSSFAIPVKSTVSDMGVRVTSRQAKIWTHPAIANGRLYLRDQEYIFAFDIRAN
jgi:outer membrane protein assembly factor BamB